MTHSTNDRYYYVGIFEKWHNDIARGYEVLPIEVNDYTGSLLAYEKLCIDDKWATSKFDLLYWNICATIIDKAYKSYDAMFDVTI